MTPSSAASNRRLPGLERAQRLDLPPLGAVADRSRQQHTFLRLQRGKGDLGRELAAVLAARDGLLRGQVRHEQLHRSADELVALVSEQVLRPGVDERNGAAVVHTHHGIGGGLDQAAEHRIGALLLVQVMSERRRAEHAARRIDDRCRGRVQRDGAPVLADADHPLFDALTAADALDQAGEVVLVAGWSQDGRAAADDLVGGVPEDPLGPGVPVRDHAIDGGADDGVG